MTKGQKEQLFLTFFLTAVAHPQECFSEVVTTVLTFLQSASTSENCFALSHKRSIPTESQKSQRRDLCPLMRLRAEPAQSSSLRLRLCFRSSRQTWTRPLEGVEQPAALKAGVFHTRKGRSQDPSVTSTRQPARSFPAQILFRHTLSVWDPSEPRWQIKSWIRQADVRLNLIDFRTSALLCPPMTLCSRRVCAVIRLICPVCEWSCCARCKQITVLIQSE